MPIRIGRGTTRTTCSALSPSITSNTKNTRLVSREKWPDEGRKGLRETIASVVNLSCGCGRRLRPLNSSKSGDRGRSSKEKRERQLGDPPLPENAFDATR